MPPQPWPQHVPGAPERAEADGQFVQFGFGWLAFDGHAASPCAGESIPIKESWLFSLFFSWCFPLLFSWPVSWLFLAPRTPAFGRLEGKPL